MTMIGKQAPFLHGVPVVASTAERNSTYASPDTDQRVHNKGTGFVERYTGTQWVQELPTGSAGPRISVLACGAVGDGTTDDGPAFAAAEALRAQVNGILVIPAPPVAYRIATRVTVDTSNVHWEGEGWPEMRCAVAHALDFAATGLRTGVKVRGLVLSNYFDTAFASCLRLTTANGINGAWQNIDLDLKIDGRSVKGEGVHLYQTYEGDVRLYSQSGPECLLRVAAQLLNSGNLRLAFTGNSVGAVTCFLNPGSSNTLLNNLQLNCGKTVGGVATHYAATTANGASAAGQQVLALTDTTGMSAGHYLVIAGTQYGQIASVDSSTQVTLRDNLQVAVASGDRVIDASFLSVVGPNTENVQMVSPHSESTSVAVWACGAKNVHCYGMLLGDNPYRGMICSNAAQQCLVLGVSFPYNLASLTLLECLDGTTVFNELVGYYAEGGTFTGTVLTDSTGTASNKAGRSLYEMQSGAVFANDSVGLNYRNGDSTVSPVLYTDGTHTVVRARAVTGGMRLLDNPGTHEALVLVGAGSPEGIVTAGVGSVYHRTDGGAATSLYVKETGAGNTGWVGK